MPSSWLIEFSGVRGADVRASGLHRFLSAWFDEDPVSHADRKGYSLGGWREDQGSVVTVVNLVSDLLQERLSELPNGAEVRFGHSFPKIARVERCELVKEASWEQLGVYSGTTQWQIEFLSPVSVRRHGIDQPWPAPGPLLSGLAAKWTKWAPTATEWSDTDDRSVLVTGVELSMKQSRHTPTPTWGAVGRVEWTWDAVDRRSPVDGPERIERLLRLAEFSGMGAYPQHGMGRVQVSGRRTPDPRAPRKYR